MSRSKRYTQPLTKEDVEFWDKSPSYWRMWYAAESNPSSSWRQRWRKEHRRRANRALELCSDYEDLQVPNRMWETTDVWDWY